MMTENHANYLLDRAWSELLKSTDKFLQAEMLFEWRTDEFKKKYGLGPNDDLTVEAIIDRRNDEQWQVAVADCRYHAQRMQAFAALHDAAGRELRRS
jgi:hypothetical protein